MLRFMRVILVLVLTVVAAAASGCRCEGQGLDAGPDAAQDAGVGSPLVLFRPPPDGTPPAFGEVPWPSDLYLDGDGTLVDAIPGLDRLVLANESVLQAALAPLNGFARSSAAYFFLSGADADPGLLPSTPDESLTPDATVLAVNVDPGSPQLGERAPVMARFLPTLGAIAVLPKPGTLLKRATRYAFVVTTRMTSELGVPLGPDAELARMLALLPAARVTSAEMLHGEAVDALVAAGAVTDPAQEIAGLAVFTTMSASEDLMAMAAAVADPVVYPDPQLQTEDTLIAPYRSFLAGAGAGGAATLDEWLGMPDVDPVTGFDFPGDDNAGGIAHDAIGVVITGAFPALRFLDSSSHVVPDDGSGPPQPQGTWLVPVTLIIPAGPQPVAGWPVVIKGHGLSNSRRGMMGIANELCRAGFAVAAIDFVQHGTRNGVADVVNSFPGSYSGSDGFPDDAGNPLAFFAFFTDGLAMRDNFRQTVADNLSLIRLLKSPALDLSATSPLLGYTPLLDAANLFWQGGSLGGIIGTMVAAYAPELRAVSLVVPAGGFLHLIGGNSPGLQPLLFGGLTAVFGTTGSEPLDSFHPLSNLVNTGFEPGDPLVHGEHLFVDPLPLGPGGTAVAHSVLVSYALDDEILPNRATDALLGAMGVPVALPAARPLDGWGLPYFTDTAPLAANVVAGGAAAGTLVTAGAVQYSPATHGLAYLRWDVRSYLPGHPFDAKADPFPLVPTPVTIEMPIVAVQQAIAHFFTTALNGGTAEIVVPLTPVEDFDGDGVTDEDEIGAGTDPYDPASN